MNRHIHARDVKLRWSGGLLLAILLTVWLGLFSFSAVPMTWQTPFQAIQALVFQAQHPSMTIMLIQEVRLPRVLCTLLVGACLGISGLLMQALTHNLLASPSLFGLNAGASLGVALTSLGMVQTSLLMQSPFLTQSVAAMLGGLLAWTIVMLLGQAWHSNRPRQHMVLVGIAISALCGALTKAIVILVDDQASSVMTWLAGSFASISWAQFSPMVLPLLCALCLSYALTPTLNLLALGDERAQTLGLRLAWIRATIAVLVLVMVGICMSTVGSIAFVGLIVPHIARQCFGYDHRWLWIGTALIGALFTASADIMSRAIVFPNETPAGAILALIGAPFFLYLVRRPQPTSQGNPQ